MTLESDHMESMAGTMDVGFKETFNIFDGISSKNWIRPKRDMSCY